MNTEDSTVLYLIDASCSELLDTLILYSSKLCECGHSFKCKSLAIRNIPRVQPANCALAEIYVYAEGSANERLTDPKYEQILA